MAKNDPTAATQRLWDTFRRALIEHVAGDSRLRLNDQRDGVVEVGMGKHRLVVSFEKNTVKAVLTFHGPDRDEPNKIRVTLHPGDKRPYQIGRRTLTAVAAAREIVSTFVNAATTN